jgi:carbamoyl-phosphate synthase large subunit
MKKNILITSAGKRVSLVNLFKEELTGIFPEAKVYTTDMNPELAPAGYVSDDCFQVPRVTDPRYLELLIQLCTEHQIGLIIPTIDTELLLLAENKEKLQQNGITAIVPSLDFVMACRDKRNSNALFQKLNIRIPEPRDKNSPIYPMFAKPYDGSLSKDLFVIRNDQELTPEIMNHPKLIFMEYIDKNQYKEYTVDLYFGQDNHLKCIVPRERIEIRAGEINKGRTRKNYLVQYLKERMEYIPGVVGCICIQLFYREEDQDVVAIEINPRFGGGYPMSYHAGANYPKYIVQEYLQNQNIEYFEDWKDNTLLLRYDTEIVVYGK